MSIEQQIAAAWKEYKPQFYNDVEYSVSTMLEASEESFSAGYLAALRSLFVEVKPEDIEDGELYDVKVKDSGYQSAFALVRGAEISFWYHDIEEGEVREVFISPLEIEKVLSQVLPSPSDLFTEIKFN